MEVNMHKLIELKTMTDKQTQAWLRKISTATDTNTLPIALLGVNEDIKDCIFRNMSVYAKTMLKKSIHEQSKKNVKESEIQKSINILGNLI